MIRSLLIDDDPFGARAVVGILDAIGAEPTVAVTIDEARGALTNTLFDVVVCRLDHRESEGLAALGSELATCPMRLIGIESRRTQNAGPIAVHALVPAFPSIDDLAWALHTDRRSGPTAHGSELSDGLLN